MATQLEFEQEGTTHSFPIALPLLIETDWILIGDLCDAQAEKHKAMSGTVTFVIHKGFRSYIKLELQVTLSDQHGGHRKTECVTINLDRLVNLDSQKATRLSNSSPSSTLEKLDRVGVDAVARGIVSELTFTLNGQVWASNLFAARKHGESEHLLDSLRSQMARSTTLSFFASGATLTTVWAKYFVASEKQVIWDPFANFSPPQESQKYEVGKAYSLPSMILSRASTRPRPITDALLSFPCMRIYFIHNTTALIQESEAVQGTEQIFRNARLTIIKQHKQGFSGFVGIQEGKSDLKAGQKVTLKFCTLGASFAAVVNLAKGTVSARLSGYIVRTVRSDLSDGRDDINAAIIERLQRASAPGARHLVDISLDYLDVDVRRQLDGIVSLRGGSTVYSGAQALLLANDLRSIPPMDFYGRIPGSAAEKDAFLATFLECLPLAFNERQKEAFFALRQMPYAHMVQGPGGTGKSEFATLACQPLLLTSPSSGPKNQVLIVCGSNINVDDLAAQALEHSRRFLVALREPIIVRLHAFDTEIAVFTDNAAWKKALSGDESQIEPAVLAELKRNGIENIEEQMAEVCEDHRLQLRHQSLGWYMRRVIGVGVLGMEDPLHVPDKFQLLTRTYRSWTDPKTPFPSKKGIESMLSKLFDHVLESADIIVTTTSNAAIPQLRSGSFNPCAIIVDEAGRLTEGQIWPILAFHGQVPTVFLGDRCQTGPFAKAREQKNGFCKQLRLPFFGRLLDAGAASTTFVRQHRFPSTVCGFLSWHFYKNELESAGSVDEHPLISSFKQFNLTHLKRDQLMVYVDMPFSIPQRTAEWKTSQLNVLQLAKVLQLVDALLATGVSGTSIGIASPYSLMDQQVQVGRGWLALKHPNEAPKITVATIDGFTGLECDIMFIPLVAGANIGFLQETSRICTALTRCRVGFVMIGNSGAMKSGEGTERGWDDSVLKRVILELTQRGMSVADNMKAAPTDMKEFLPKEKDLLPFESRDCFHCGRIGHIARSCPSK